LSLLFAVFYGIIQGITEFLPVSSSGHLAIMQRFFGMEDVEANYFSFGVLLHLATLVAVFIVYWRDIIPLIPAVFTMFKKLFKGNIKEFTDNEKFVIYIIIATLPLLPAVLLKDYVEVIFSHTKIIGGILMFNAVVLFISDGLAKGNKNISKATPINALVVGLCQMVAIVPGLSRSGSTITGGLTQGFDREFAVKFSFIMSIPAILGANILEIPEMLSTAVPSGDIIKYAAGMIAALIAGIAAMKLLNYISRKSNFRIFSYYSFAIGLVTLIFA
jgi:Uncharacterized bacitracin resistance protein